MDTPRESRSTALLWGGLVVCLAMLALGLFLVFQYGSLTVPPSITRVGESGVQPEQDSSGFGFVPISDNPSWDPDQERRGSCRPIGSVTWEDGTPAAGAIIEVLHDPSGEFGSYWNWLDSGVRTDPSGMYRLPIQNRCPLRIAATVPGKGRGIEEEMPRFDGSGIDPYPDPYRRDIVIEPSSSVPGLVQNPEGQPIEGATVYLSTWRALEFEAGRLSPEDRGDGWSDPELVNEMYSSWSRSVQTDEAGKFEFDAVVPDRWVFRAEAEGYTPDQVEQAIQRGGDQLVAITLHPIVARSLKVIDERDSPIPGATVWILRSSIDSVDRSGETLAIATLETGNNGIVTFGDIDILGRAVVATADGYDERIIEPTDRDLSVFLIRLGPGGCVTGILEPRFRGSMICHWLNWSRYDSDQLGLVVPTSYVTTNEAGEFTSCGFPSGIAELSLMCLVTSDPEPFSGEVWSGTLYVKPGETIDLGTIHRQ